MSETHGGSTALSGYLYQFLAVVGVQVSAAPGNQKAPTDDALFTVHEWLDQDGSVKSSADRSVTFVQVKYSEKGENEKIPPSELKQIVERLEVAAQKAEEKGWIISGFLLVSNRGLSEESIKKAEKCELGIEKQTAPKPNTKVKSSKKKAKTLWTEDHDAIARDLVDQIWTQTDVMGQLRNFANRYGVLDFEFSKAIQTLISQTFIDVSTLKESGLNREDLIEILTGERQAISLVKENQSEIQQSEIETITGKITGTYTIFPRECIQNLFDTYPAYSIFVFYGNGGMGKTASLREVAFEHSAATKGPFVRGGLARDVRQDWASKCSDDWRHVKPPSAEKDIERAIQRLQKANPHIEKPVLLVALDGIDENPKSEVQENLAELISILAKNYDPLQLRAKDSFKLLVTCRKLEEFLDYFPHDPDDFEVRQYDCYKAIPFDQFTPTEFEQIVARDAVEFKDVLIPNDSPSIELAAPSLELSGREERAANTARYRYLRDPLVWRAFVSLKADKQKEVLVGNSAGFTALGELIFQRFAKKAYRRNRDLEQNREIVLKGMKAVAQGMENQPSPWTRLDWLQKGSQTRVASENECAILFRESLLAGLIEGDLEAWNWRNPAIPHFLKNANA